MTSGPTQFAVHTCLLYHAIRQCLAYADTVSCLLQRRVNLMAEEGVTFVTNAHVGRNADMRAIRESADAVVLAAGATKPRDLPIEGR